MITKEEYNNLPLEGKLNYIGINKIEPNNDIELKEFNYDKRYYDVAESETNIIIDPREIIGTQHASYYKNNLSAAFNNLKRGYENIDFYYTNPNHYMEGNRRSGDIISIYKVEGKGIFINQGNNRLILAMILGLPKVKVDYCEVFLINQKLKLYIDKLEGNGFKVYFNEDSKYILSARSLTIRYDEISLDIEKDAEKLEKFYNNFINLKYSRLKILKYKFLSKYNKNYLYKFYEEDEIENWFHKNYMKFLNK